MKALSLDPFEIRNMSDDEVRQKASKCANGEYAVEVCRNCGAISSNIDGDYRIARVLKVQCLHCVQSK